MNITEIITIVGTSFTIIATIVGATVYVTRVISTINEKKLQAENENLSQKLIQMEMNYKEISERMSTIQRRGSAALVQKMEIDAEVTLAKKTLRVAACSILVPYPFANDEEFVFLSIDSEAADKLKRTRIPIGKGVAGYVYNSGRPHISGDPQRDLKFFDKVDARSGFKTENILCLPLLTSHGTVGVMNFVNKIADDVFNDNDLELALRISQNITPKVAAFCVDHSNFDILDLSSSKEAKEATVIITDLSRSSLLTSSMSMPVVEDLFNEYFERIIEIGFKYGGVVDKYLGDGFIMHFNISRPIRDHRMAAVKSSLAMVQEFAKLRQSWTNYGFPASKVYHRIAVESGDVYEVFLGHPQYRQATLMGEALIAASNLLDAANRTKDLIIVGQDIHRNIGDNLVAREIPKEQLGKAEVLISSAYELIKLKDANIAYNY